MLDMKYRVFTPKKEVKTPPIRDPLSLQNFNKMNPAKMILQRAFKSKKFSSPPVHVNHFEKSSFYDLKRTTTKDSETDSMSST